MEIASRESRSGRKVFPKEGWVYTAQPPSWSEMVGLRSRDDARRR